MTRSLLRQFIAVFHLLMLTFLAAHAQITGVTSDQAPPVAGAGHDYIHMLNETVNPANGAVSIRVSVPVPPGRGIAVPFAFGYDSNAAHHFLVSNASAGPADNMSYLGRGGWSYLTPQLSMQEKDDTWTTTSPFQRYDCYYFTDYVLTDLGAATHQLQISAAQPLTANNCSGIGSPPANGVTPSEHLLGSEDRFQASTSAVPAPTFVTPPAVKAADLDGTTYYFSNSNAHFNSSVNGWTAIPNWIEDRNGNQVSFTDNGNGNFSVTDTLGRTALSSSGFGVTGNTVTVSGVSTPYTLTWANSGSNFTYTSQLTDLAGTSTQCSGPGGTATYNVTLPEITGIQLPNGKSYQFQYNATSGLLSKIIYPTGGYVRYVWGINSLSDELVYLDSLHEQNCQWIHDTQAVTDRYVSFDGTNEVLHQHFTYSTSYSSAGCTLCKHISAKSTTMTTYDLVRGTNFKTTYNYSMTSITPAPNDAIVFNSSSTPVEKTITYYDTNGAVLRTVTKAFIGGMQVPPDETIALDNQQTSQTTHTYLSRSTGRQCSAGSTAYCTDPLKVLIDQYDYDYGSGVPGTLIKHTHVDYATFASTPIFPSAPSILDRTSDLIIYDGGGNRVAETDYSYDETTLGLVTATEHDDTNYPATYTIRGNATTKTDQCFQGTQTCSNPVTTYSYDQTGQVLSIKDPNLNITQYSYTDKFQSGSGTAPGATNAYLTTITDPTVNGITLHKYFQYAYSDGQLTQSQDDNEKTAGLFTSYAYNDSLRRLTETDYPDGGQTLLSYDDTAPSPAVTTCTNINGTASATCSAVTLPTGWIVKLATMDGVGQAVQNQLASDPEGSDSTDMAYDGTGRVYTRSNPHRPSPSTSDGTATYTYDALGRTTTVAEPDGSSVGTTYSGNQTTVTDETGNKRTSVTDGLGRLVQVLEDPGSSPHLNYESDYTYDALNNLLSVTQKGGSTTSSQWRTRTFTYDSLSRLVCAANPEIQIVSCPTSAPFPFGTVTYTYDANGNPASKTAPSPNQPSTGTSTVTTTYTYDALNRITGKTYADTYANPPTSPVLYGYDGKAITGCPADTPPSNTDTYPKGRRTSMCDGAEAATWTHDIMGRNRQESRSIAAIIGQHDNDTYNLDGSVATATSLGYAVQYSYSGAGRPIYLVGTNIYVQNNSATYAPFGGLTSAKLGQQPITITNAYNNRLQPLLISAAGATSVLSLCYDFHLKTSVTSGPCSFSASTVGDNGNVFQIVNNRDNNRTQNFLYDPLNRISQAYSSGPNWGETYGPTATNPGVQPTSSGIDAWGNLTNRSGVTGKSNTEGWSCLATNQNQIGSCAITYDPAGNTTKNGTITYTYDAENRLIATQGMSYLYDGDGKRVEKCAQGTTPGTCATGATGTLYWTGPGNNTLAETDLAGNVLENYIFFNGQRIARREPGTPATIHFYFSDHLGSHGVVTNNTGSTCEQDIDYFPYGGVEQDYCPTVAQHFKFTAKERDTESGLDNFGARYNASTMGRFITPDSGADEVLSVPLPYAELGNPQSLNLYSYVHNNPLSFTDPDGQNVFICIFNGPGGSHCVDLTDEQYRNLYNQQNGHQGVNMPGGAFPGGAITCGGEVCGSASYHEAGLEDVSGGILMGVGIGKAAAFLFGRIAGALGEALGRGTGEAIGGTAGRTGEVLLSGGTKQAAKDIVEGLADGAQKASAKRAVAAATRSESISISRSADGTLTITRTRLGFDGLQTFTKTIDSSGTSATVQTAHDSAGNLVHYDPKN